MAYFAIGLAGIVGSLLRYGVSVWTHDLYSGVFPLGTLICNLIGSFILSWFFVWAASFSSMPVNLRIGIGTGLLGSFTTFSSFSMETVELIQAHNFLIAAVYVSVSVLGGLLMSWLGFAWSSAALNKRSSENT